MRDAGLWASDPAGGGGLSIMCPIAAVFPVPPRPVCTLWSAPACSPSLRYLLSTCCHPRWRPCTVTPSSPLTLTPLFLQALALAAWVVHTAYNSTGNRVRHKDMQLVAG